MKEDEIIIATKNSGKFEEFRSLLSKYFKNIYSLNDFKDIPEIIEDGKSFEENAQIKANIVCKKFGKLTLADDSGLVVDSLNGDPGIFSARYAGEGASDDDNIDKLLNELGDNKVRSARFVCSLVLVSLSSENRVFNGVCSGTITTEKIGNNGFGYDPVFFVPEFGRTMAELDPQEKNSISHRAKAVSKLISYLEKK